MVFSILNDSRKPYTNPAGPNHLLFFNPKKKGQQKDPYSKQKTMSLCVLSIAYSLWCKESISDTENLKWSAGFQDFLVLAVTYAELSQQTSMTEVRKELKTLKKPLIWKKKKGHGINTTHTEKNLFCTQAYALPSCSYKSHTESACSVKNYYFQAWLVILDSST